MKINFIRFLNEFQREGKFLRGKFIFYYLIPKCNNPLGLGEFKPLVKHMFKVIAKVLTNRLRNVMNGVLTNRLGKIMNGLIDGT